MEAIIVILVLLWVLGIVRIPGVVLPNLNLFVFFGRTITLVDLFLLAVALWLISHLPSPLREIVGIILLLHILTILGIVTIAGMPNIFGIAIVAGTFLYLIAKK